MENTQEETNGYLEIEPVEIEAQEEPSVVQEVDLGLNSIAERMDREICADVKDLNENAGFF